MRTKLFMAAALVVLAVAGAVYAGTISSSNSAATDCCFPGSDCCFPGSPCCEDCCSAELPCCDPPQACCFADKTKTAAPSCCSAGEPCCDPPQECCLAAGK